MKTLRGYTAELLSENIDDLTATILSNRGLTLAPAELEAFFHPSFGNLHDPYLLDGMDKAVERIMKAREDKERVVIFGDYDVDGVSATALLVRFFNDIGITVSYRLPHRVHDGYGLKKHFIDELAEKDVKLIITVDCGSRDVEAIKYAREKGIDVIISDHHTVPDVLPADTIAILNPKIVESGYPFSYLSGSGVAFKILSALAREIFPSEKYESIIAEYVDFAALGTIADCMPLIGENRTIASLGLARLKKSRSHGLRRLIEGKYTHMDADIVGFHIGPRINAAGRMDSPYKALTLLLAAEDRLDPILEEIENLNTKRKTTTEYFIKHAMEVVDRDCPILFYDSTDIEHGIIGLIAGRLTDAFDKPSIALKDEGDRLVASCRSPEHTDITSLLETCREYFIAFWGHKQAAGFSIRREHFADFRAKIEQELLQRQDGIKVVPKTLQIDAPIVLRDITPEFFQTLSVFKPYGIGNAKPLFLLWDFFFSGIEYLGKDGKHLRFLEPSRQFSINAFGFGEHYDLFRQQKSLSLIVEVSEETWQGRKKIVLNVRDVMM